MPSSLEALIDRAFAHSLVYRLRQILVGKDDRAYRRLLGDLDGRTVLELGCGPGTNLGLLSACEGYLGVDINPQYVETARRLDPTREFIAADALDFEPDRQFDVILVDSFLHHLDDEGVGQILAKVRGWLPVEGVAILHEPLASAPGEAFHRLLERLDRGDFFRALDHWQRLIAEAELEVDRLELYELRIAGFASHHMAGLRLGRERRTPDSALETRGPR